MMDYAQQLNAIRIELERVIVNMTSKVTNIVSLGLVGYLPISVLVLSLFLQYLSPQAISLFAKVN